MKKQNDSKNKQPWHRKPSFGSLYTMAGSKYIYISCNYYKQRLRFPTDKVDTPKNWDELCDFLAEVGQKIRNRTFVFAKTFYWFDKDIKEHFTKLEGGDFKPEPEHVLFEDFAKDWMERKIPTFASITKQRDYREALNSRIIPFFGQMSFAGITAKVVESFIDNLKRSNGSGKVLSIKRIKNIIGPMTKVWAAACNEHNWSLNSPFFDISSKYSEIGDIELQRKEFEAAMREDGDEEIVDSRDVFLFSEWQKLRKAIDPHYHPVLELLLRGLIGSELEGLQKRQIKDNEILIRCAVIREKGGKIHLRYKPKNWYRKREIPLTGRMSTMMEQAAALSTSSRIITFDNNIERPANAFILTMKDGSFFNYNSFRKTVWDKAIQEAGLDDRVPYALRHTFVQWSLLVGVNKNRLVDLMGHSSKKMIDENYGAYRKGLVDERQKILDYLGEDFLALEELRTAFPERYQERMAVPDMPPQKAQAPAPTITFCQSFGQSQGLYADNYAT
jgi:integrase